MEIKPSKVIVVIPITRIENKSIITNKSEFNRYLLSCNDNYCKIVKPIKKPIKESDLNDKRK